MTVSLVRTLQRRVTLANVSLLLTSVSLALAPTLSVHAQAAAGAVRGVAKTQQDSTPIPFALVRLVLVDSENAGGRQSITNEQGQFQFTSVPVGRYRLQLLRIGYRPVVSPVIEVSANETSAQELRGSMIGLPLPTVVVYGDGACLTGDRVANDPYLTTLWDDAQMGVQIRRAFDERYRYKRELFQTNEIAVPSRPVEKRQRADTLASEPDSVHVRYERLRAKRAAEGYGKGNHLILPDERELLDDTFLHTHCILPGVLEAGGSTGIRFRQASPRRDGFGLQGTIWVDSETRLMRRLELEYLNGDKPFSHVSVEYADVAVAGRTLRLPTMGVFSLQLPEAPRGTTGTGHLTFRYWGFEEVRAR